MEPFTLTLIILRTNPLTKDSSAYSFLNMRKPSRECSSRSSLGECAHKLEEPQVEIFLLLWEALQVAP